MTEWSSTSGALVVTLRSGLVLAYRPTDATPAHGTVDGSAGVGV